MEHAGAGNFAMPVKGGHRELSDEDVDAAVLYMLGITFPDRPAEYAFLKTVRHLPGS